MRTTSWNQCRTVSLIWISSAILFLSLFDMASQNARRFPSPGSGSRMPGEDQRSRLYDKMEMDLDKQGTVFLGGGEASLSLSLSEIFSIKDGSIAPVLKVSVPICPCLSSGAGDGVAPEYRFLGPDIQWLIKNLLILERRPWMKLTRP